MLSLVACRATHPGLRNQRASCSMRRRPATAAAAPQKIDPPPRLRRSRLDAVPRASALGMVPSMARWRCQNQPDQAGSRLGRRRIALRRRKLRQGVSGSPDLEQPCVLGEERERARERRLGARVSWLGIEGLQSFSRSSGSSVVVLRASTLHGPNWLKGDARVAVKKIQLNILVQRSRCSPVNYPTVETYLLKVPQNAGLSPRLKLR
jgi:hypothetical protein